MPSIEYEQMPLVANKYSVGQRLGGGKFGQVFLGKNERTGENVAVKFESAEQEVHLLKHESTILNFLYSKLCRNVPPVLWFGPFCNDNGSNSSTAMVLPHYAESLHDFVQTCSNSRAAASSAFLRSATLILKQIHSHDVIHRDIKPDNWMFRTSRAGDKEMILIDFGLATFYSYGEGEATTTSHGSIIGTPKFASWFVHCGLKYEKRDDLLSALYIALWIFHGDGLWNTVEMDSNDDDANTYSGLEINLALNEEVDVMESCDVRYPLNTWLKKAKCKQNVVRLCRELGDALGDDESVPRMADALYANNTEYVYSLYA